MVGDISYIFFRSFMMVISLVDFELCKHKNLCNVYKDDMIIFIVIIFSACEKTSQPVTQST